MAELNSSRLREKRQAKATLVRILGLDAVVRLRWGMGRRPSDLELLAALAMQGPQAVIAVEGD